MLLYCVGALAQGVDFRDITLAEALGQAADEKRPVFLDCYTAWCGPCKKMAEEVFTLKEAGDYFNRKFVNIKIDMEKGEGPDVAKRYGVKAYPTFIVIGAGGAEMCRITGGGTLNDFIARLEIWLDEKRSPDILAQKYESGRIGKRELTNYWLMMRSTGSANKELTDQVSERLWAMLSRGDRLKEQYWPLVASRASLPVGGGMDFVVTNRMALERNGGAVEVDGVIYNAYYRFLGEVIKSPLTAEQAAILPQIMAAFDAVEVSGKDELLAMARLAEAKAEAKAEAADGVDRYLTVLEEVGDRLPAVTKYPAFRAAESMVPAQESKAYFARLSKRAVKFADIPGSVLRQQLANKAAWYARRATVGVHWEDFDSFDALLAQAVREKRRIFLDCHTSWCGACKIMDRWEFPKEELGDFLNENFINVRMDMEKGEGPEIARRYGVRRLSDLCDRRSRRFDAPRAGWRKLRREVHSTD